MHTDQSDAHPRSRLAKTMEHFWLHAASIILDLQGDLSGGAEDSNVCLGGAGMPMHVGQGFLQHAEQRQFDGVRQTHRICGRVYRDLESAAPGKALDVPPCGRYHPHRIHGRRVQQIGERANFTDALFHQLFRLRPQFGSGRRLLEQVYVEL